MNKQIAQFDKVLVMDCETTGIQRGSCLYPCRAKNNGYYQPISWGMIVANMQTLKPIEDLYVEIQWDGKSIWDNNAQKVHGLSIEYLQENGVTEIEAVEQIGSLIMDHWGPENNIHIMGHNPNFDLAFLDDMFKRYDIELKFSHRMYDTNSLGGILLNCFTSDQLFTAMGMPHRNEHNALEDARCTLESARKLKLLWNTFV
jgi:DNA polymerase III epsilon subunit-like protein